MAQNTPNRPIDQSTVDSFKSSGETPPILFMLHNHQKELLSLAILLFFVFTIFLGRILVESNQDTRSDASFTNTCQPQPPNLQLYQPNNLSQINPNAATQLTVAYITAHTCYPHLTQIDIYLKNNTQTDFQLTCSLSNQTTIPAVFRCPLDPTQLEPNHTYLWYAQIKNEAYVTQTPTYSFTTTPE